MVRKTRPCFVLRFHHDMMYMTNVKNGSTIVRSGRGGGGSTFGNISDFWVKLTNTGGLGFRKVVVLVLLLNLYTFHVSSFSNPVEITITCIGDECYPPLSPIEPYHSASLPQKSQAFNHQVLR